MNYLVSDTDMTAIADAIRTAGGTASLLQFPQGFVDAIGNLGGVERYYLQVKRLLKM